MCVCMIRWICWQLLEFKTFTWQGGGLLFDTLRCVHVHKLVVHALSLHRWHAGTHAA